MADSSSVDVILEFLKRNNFTRAEAALLSELNNRSDLNGVLQKLTIEDRGLSRPLEEANGGTTGLENLGKISKNCGEVSKESSSQGCNEISKELIVKEIECGTGRNGSDTKWKSVAYIGDQSKVNASVGTSDKNFTFSKGSDDTVLDLYSWKYSQNNNGPVVSYPSDAPIVSANNFSGFQASGKSKLNLGEAFESGNLNTKSGEDDSFPAQKRIAWSGSTSKAILDAKNDRSQGAGLGVVDQQHKRTEGYPKDDCADNPWSRSDELSQSSAEIWKDCSVKTVLPFSKADASTSYDSNVVIDEKSDIKRKTEINDVRAAVKEQVDEVGRALYFGKTQGNEPKDFNYLGFPHPPENQKEEFPRLPPVKLKSEDKSFNIHWEGKFERDLPGSKSTSAENTYLIGSFLDVPIGQEINTSGLLIYLLSLPHSCA